MCVGRHQSRPGRRGLTGQRIDQCHEFPLDHANAASQIQTEVERHLLVARPTGVQPFPGIANPFDQLAFHERMHVLVVAINKAGVGHAALANLLQRGSDGRRVFGREHAGQGEPLGPRQTPVHVVLEQSAVESERRLKLKDLFVWRRVKPAGPQMCH